MAKPITLKASLRLAIVALLATLTFTTGQARQVQATSSKCPAYEQALKQVGLPVAVFSQIMYRESRCEPKAIGWNYHKGKSHRDCRLAPASVYKRCRAVRSYDSGLLQVNSGWVTLTAVTCKAKKGDLTVLLNPACNLAVAAAIYRSSGIGNWRATSGLK